MPFIFSRIVLIRSFVQSRKNLHLLQTSTSQKAFPKHFGLIFFLGIFLSFYFGVKALPDPPIDPPMLLLIRGTDRAANPHLRSLSLCYPVLRLTHSLCVFIPYGSLMFFVLSFSAVSLMLDVFFMHHGSLSSLGLSHRLWLTSFFS